MPFTGYLSKFSGAHMNAKKKGHLIDQAATSAPVMSKAQCKRTQHTTVICFTEMTLDIIAHKIIKNLSGGNGRKYALSYTTTWISTVIHTSLRIHCTSNLPGLVSHTKCTKTSQRNSNSPKKTSHSNSFSPTKKTSRSTPNALKKHKLLSRTQHNTLSPRTRERPRQIGRAHV